MQVNSLDNKVSAEKDKNGIWIFKANESELIKKKALKKEYHDLPAYPIINEYEKQIKDNIDVFLGSLTKQLVKKLKSFI